MKRGLVRVLRESPNFKVPIGHTNSVRLRAMNFIREFWGGKIGTVGTVGDEQRAAIMLLRDINN